VAVGKWSVVLDSILVRDVTGQQTGGLGLPFENLSTPIWKDNCWRRHFKPKLTRAGLGWVNFQVLRKTHSCLLAELDVDLQVRADQMGHTVDVNQNRYTKSSLGRRQDAVNLLEQKIGVM
jgi:integrase